MTTDWTETERLHLIRIIARWALKDGPKRHPELMRWDLECIVYLTSESASFLERNKTNFGNALVEYEREVESPMTVVNEQTEMTPESWADLVEYFKEREAEPSVGIPIFVNSVEGLIQSMSVSLAQDEDGLSTTTFTGVIIPKKDTNATSL